MCEVIIPQISYEILWKIRRILTEFCKTCPMLWSVKKSPWIYPNRVNTHDSESWDTQSQHSWVDTESQHPCCEVWRNHLEFTLTNLWNDGEIILQSFQTLKNGYGRHASVGKRSAIFNYSLASGIQRNFSLVLKQFIVQCLTILNVNNKDRSEKGDRSCRVVNDTKFEPWFLVDTAETGHVKFWKVEQVAQAFLQPPVHDCSRLMFRNTMTKSSVLKSKRA